MAEILLLPTRPHSVDQAGRLYADLAAAHTQGADLGTRAPHIQADGEKLLELSRTLECAIEDLDLLLNKLGLQDPTTCEALRRFISATQGLAHTAQRFPSAL